MKIKINNQTWTVKFVPGEDSHLQDEKDTYLGLTYYLTQEIFIRKDMASETTRATVIHELTHAAISAYGHSADKYDEEAVCNFTGAHLDEIYNLTEKILKKYGG